MKTEITFAPLQDLIGDTYDSALDPDRWKPTLLRFGAARNFRLFLHCTEKIADPGIADD